GLVRRWESPWPEADTHGGVAWAKSARPARARGRSMGTSGVGAAILTTAGPRTPWLRAPGTPLGAGRSPRARLLSGSLLASLGAEALVLEKALESVFESVGGRRGPCRL